MLPLRSRSLAQPHGAGRRAPSSLTCAAVKAKSARQVCCNKTLVAKPETKDKVMELCQDVTRFSRQRMADRASGIVEFNCSLDGWEDNVFHFWERYDNNAALGRHNTTPEVEQFMRTVVPLLEKPVGMALYEYRDGQIGAVCLQGGPKGEGGLDDATGASGAAGGASYKQTSRLTQLTTVVHDDDDSSSSGSSSKRTPGGGGSSSSDAWWSFAGSQPAALGAIAGVAAVLAAAAFKLTGH